METEPGTLGSSSVEPSTSNQHGDNDATFEDIPLESGTEPEPAETNHEEDRGHFVRSKPVCKRSRKKGRWSLREPSETVDPSPNLLSSHEHFFARTHTSFGQVEFSDALSATGIGAQNLRTRRKSTPHFTYPIVEDKEFDSNHVIIDRHASVEQDHVTPTPKFKSRRTSITSFSFSSRRKQSFDSLFASSTPFTNPLRLKLNFLSVDDLSQDFELGPHIKKSLSFFPKNSGFSSRRSSYKELSGRDSTLKQAQLHFKFPSLLTRRTSGDSLDFLSTNTTKPKLPLRYKKHSLPVLWRNVELDTMTNYQYNGCLHNDSAKEQSDYDAVEEREPPMKTFDEVVFDVLRVTPEEYAQQLTLLVWPLFAAITPDEVSSCGWVKKDKWEQCPHICAMTQRFNHTSFWVIREILHASTNKIRSEIITLFIKVAKKLYDLNNMHSLMAVIQSLNSSSIIRLSQTWALVSKNNRTTFERLLALVKEDGNRAELRAHMDTIKLPCIPFLGMYLSDVMYIDSAYPDTGGLESRERTNRMNNILRILSEFQQSKYDHLHEKTHIKRYLKNVQYIEELQKFVEEANYRDSLKIEPVHVQQSNNSNRTKGNFTSQTSDLSLPRYSQTPPTADKFHPGHRKSRSLGREAAFGGVILRNRLENAKTPKRQTWYSRAKQRESTVWYLSPIKSCFSSENLSHSADGVSSGSLRVPAVTMTTSLLDDSIIATSSSLSSSFTKTSITNSNSNSLGSSCSNSGSEVSEHDEMSSSDRTLDISSDDFRTCSFEGCLKRKVVSKHGKKTPMSSWSKYWVCICDNKLVYFAPKTFKGSDRENFKSRPCKVTSIHGWMVFDCSEENKSDSFRLNNPETGNMYRFQCDSKEVALVWIHYLKEAAEGRRQPERDLINLDDS